MGNCFGRCLTSGKNSLRHSTDEQEADELVQEDETKEDNFIFKIIKFKRKKNRPEFIERFWEQKESTYKRLNIQENPVECSEIQLQCLDANSLLRTTPASTTALDLPLSTMKFNQNLNTNNNNQYHHQNSNHQQYHHENCYKNQIFSSDNNGIINSCCNNSNLINNVNSSRASSSLDLEWEHEYSNNIIERRIIIDADETQNITQSWYFIPSEDDEIITAKIKKHNISNQQLLNICDDDDNEDDDDDDDDNDEHAIDIVNCKNKKLIKFNDSTNNLSENQNIYYIKNSSKCISMTSTPSSIGPSSGINYNILSPQQCNNIKHNQQQQIQQQGNIMRTPSRTSWSHISTPESLEWDIDEEQQKQLRIEDDNLDHETLELLHEIELLKNKVLNETGSGLIDDKFEMNWKDDSS